MKFISTRNKNAIVSGTEAIVKGLSDDGGLFVPAEFPQFSLKEIEAMANLDYSERATLIINKFLPQFSQEQLLDYTNSAYSKFDGDPAPVVKIDGSVYVLELWHGPTHAFKDMALSLLPYLLVGSKADVNANENTLILVATSGDTGKAALEGFKDVKGTDVIVFYPQDGVSNMQKMQMMTQKGDNVYVCGINGNFDDAQTAVKQIFNDARISKQLSTKGYALSSANSINWGRLVPQIVYYFSAYVDMLDSSQIEIGEKINFCVPSGNFGNILAGFYAKQMGLPINKLISASNKNNVLADFIKTGEYSIAREFYKTSSPSMDILISSNLERLLFEICGRDDKLVKERMASLKDSKAYKITDKELEFLKDNFYGGYASEEQVAKSLDYYYDEYGYIADTHTSVALNVYDQYKKETGDETNTVVVSTASPYKFVEDVLKFIGEKPAKDEISSLKKLEDLTALPIPEDFKELPKAQKRFTDTIDKNDSQKVVLEYCDKK